MHLRLRLSAALGVLLLVAVPVAAQASVGVGVQAGPVQLSGAAHPGGTYALPPVYVVNTGTEPESVAIRIERISPGTGRTVPQAWIHVSGLPSSLGHGQSARIPLNLVVPAGAKPGRYFSDVVVTGSADLTAGSAHLAVAVIGALSLALLLMLRSGISIRVERATAGAAAGSGGGRAA